MQASPRHLDSRPRLHLHDALRESFLGRFADDALDRILEHGFLVEHSQGSLLYRAGDEPYAAALIVSGLVRTFLTAPDGRQVTLRYSRAGDIVGLVTLMGGPSLAHVQALTDGSALFFKAGALEALDPHGAQIAWAVAQEMARLVYGLMDEFAGAAFGTVRQRVARHLLDLATEQPLGQPLTAHVSHQDIADAVGSVRVVVARVLGGLRDDGLVETGRDRIVLRDPARLHLEARMRTTDVT